MKNELNNQLFTVRKNSLEYLWYLNIDNHESRVLRENLRNRRFAQVELFLNSCTDSNDRTYYFESAADWRNTSRFLADWFNTNTPNSHLASLIHRSKQAWKHFDLTSTSRRSRKFREELSLLDVEFSEFSSEYQQHACQYYWHIWIARALGDASHARELFKLSFERAPHNKANAWVSLNTEGDAWFGSLGQLYDYCRWLLPQMPANIGASTLLIEAHYLNGMSLAQSYWKDSSVRENIIYAFEECTHEGFQGITGTRSLHYLAWGLTKIGEYPRAKNIFEQIQGVPPGSPWGSLKFGLDAIYSLYRTERKKAMKTKGFTNPTSTVPDPQSHP